MYNINFKIENNTQCPKENSTTAHIVIYFADFEIYMCKCTTSHVYIFIGKITGSANIIILFYIVQHKRVHINKYIKVIA